MSSYSLTRSRTIQYVGILLVLATLAAGYWYFSVRAGVKTNTSGSQPQGIGDLSAGLSAYWKLDENTGTSAGDASTNANTGTLVNGPTWSTGQIGSAVTFDGTNDEITTTTDQGTAANLKIITISAWFKTATASGKKLIGLENTQTGTGTTSNDRIIFMGTDGKIRFGVFTSAIKEVTSTTTLNDNTWHHAVGVSTGDNGTISLYIDGVLQGTTSLGGTIFTYATTSYWRIGGYKMGWTNSADGYYTGQLDEIRVYNRVLSPDEVAQLYRLTTPTGVDTSLKGYWSFNSDALSGTTAYDWSGARNNGTLTNGPTVAEGRVGQALNFDGSNDYVSLGNPTSLQFTGSHTLSAWIKSDTVTDQDIISKGSSNTNGYSYLMNANNDLSSNLFACLVSPDGTGGAAATRYSAAIDSVGNWYYVTCVYSSSGQTLDVYVNGVKSNGTLVGTVPASIFNTTDNVDIGRRYDNQHFWDGLIDEPRIYNRALSAAEIKSLYDLGQSDKTNTSAGQAQGTGRLDSGLSAYWKLDENTGTSAGDASTNANTGTLTGGPTWSTGQIGSAVTFDGTDDEITTTTNWGTAADVKAFTMSIWFKTSSASGKKLIGLENVQTGTGAGFSDRQFWMGLDGKIRFGVFTSIVVPKEVASTTTLNDNNWHHAVGVSTGDNGTMSFYIDGALQGTTSISALVYTYATNSYWRLGGYRNTGGWTSASSGYFTGQLDEARVYDRIFSADEIAALYRLTAPTGVDSGLKGYWSFNGQDMAGTTAYDRSGARNTGTLTNGPAIAEGRVGQALNFDGSNDYVDAGSATSLDDIVNLTACAWIRPNTQVGIGTWTTFLSKFNGLGWTFQLYGSTSTATQLTFWRSFNVAVGEWRVTGLNITPGVWQHVCVTYNDSSTTNDPIMYINGSLQPSTETASPSGSPQSEASGILSVGSAGPSSEFFNGSVDEARVYNRILSVGEIKSLYDASQSDKTNTSASQPQGTGRLDSGLAGYWKLDDGTSGATPTTAADSSTNANTGTLTGGPTWTAGQVGSAVSFDGTNDYIDTGSGSSGVNASQNIAISVWIYLRTATAYRGIVVKSAACDESTAKYMFELNGSGNPAFWMNGSSLLNGSALTLNQWTHVVVTNSAAGSAMYYNGALVASGSAGTAPASSTDNWKFGTCPGLYYLDANLDEVRLYNRSLSADEVSQLYRLASPTGTDTSLKGYWSFNGQDMSGTTAYDRSGAGNTGTLTNGPAITEGKLGQALSFDGANDSVTLATGPIVTGEVSVFVWIKPSAIGAKRDIIADMTAGNTPGAYYLFMDSSGKINAQWGGFSSFCTGSTVLSANAWYHVGFIRSGSTGNWTCKSYVNGVQDSTASSIATNPNNHANYSIGNAGAGSNPFSGVIDEVRVYNRALSVAEIKALYSSGK